MEADCKNCISPSLFLAVYVQTSTMNETEPYEEWNSFKLFQSLSLNVKMNVFR